MQAAQLTKHYAPRTRHISAEVLCVVANILRNFKKMPQWILAALCERLPGANLRRLHISWAIQATAAVCGISHRMVVNCFKRWEEQMEEGGLAPVLGETQRKQTDDTTAHDKQMRMMEILIQEDCA